MRPPRSAGARLRPDDGCMPAPSPSNPESSGRDQSSWLTPSMRVPAFTPGTAHHERNAKRRFVHEIAVNVLAMFPKRFAVIRRHDRRACCPVLPPSRRAVTRSAPPARRSTQPHHRTAAPRIGWRTVQGACRAHGVVQVHPGEESPVSAAIEPADGFGRDRIARSLIRPPRSKRSE